MKFSLSKKIIVKTSFRGIHNWPEASQYAGDEVSFLEHPHRHTFHVQGELEVSDSDREVEFFVFQKVLDESIKELYPYEGLTFLLGRRSCETMAEEIINQIRTKLNYKGMVAVEVWEDGEVGAKVTSKEVLEAIEPNLIDGIKNLLKGLKK